MKRILHLIWRIDGGGIERFCFNLLRNLDTEKYHFDFAVCGRTKNNEAEAQFKKYGCKIWYLPYIEGNEGKKKYLFELKRLLHSGSFDIVHSHLAFMNVWTLREAKLAGIKTRISHIHVAGNTSKKNAFFNIARRALLKRYSTYSIACSDTVNKYYYNGTATVIYSGVDIKRFFFTGRKKNNIIIIASRVAPEKNPEFILQIAKELIRLDTAYKFFWCGGGTEKYKNSEENVISFIGDIENIEDYYKKASFMLMPSLKEGLGMAAIEAQLAGCFVFASDQVPKDTDLGMICYYPLDTPKQWAKRINEFINSGDIAERVLNSTRIKDFDIQNIAKMIEKIYDYSS